MANENDERTTLTLLVDVEKSLVRLRKKTKRLALDLEKAQRRIAALEKKSGSKAEPRNKTALIAEAATVPKPAKRKALGRGLAQIRNVS